MMAVEEHSEADRRNVPIAMRETSDAGALAPDPLVSVLMIVFNHAEYLPEAIESIVSQKTEFPFELIIGEDCSGDGSLEIALAYQQRYPQLIRVLHADCNIGMNANSRRVRAAARGQYLAWCEGDDYWCARDKLALQVDMIASDDRIGAVHSDWVRAHRVDGEWRVAWSEPVHRGIRGESLGGDLLHIFHHPLILRTCTLLFRASIARAMDDSVFGRKDFPFDDTVTSLFITSRWKVAYLPQVTAVYRVSENSALRSGLRSRLAFLESALVFDDDAREYMDNAPGYPDSYRAELSIGLALWAIRARSLPHLRMAIRQGPGRLGPLRFIRSSLDALRVRIPRLLPRAPQAG